MDSTKENKITKETELFIKIIEKLNINNTQDLIKFDKKSLNNILFCFNNIISSYINESINSGSKNKYIHNIIKRKRISYLLKIFNDIKETKNIIKYKESMIQNKQIINHFFIIICFSFYLKVISFKENNNKKGIILLYNLMNKIFSLFGKLYLEGIIEINYFELILKLLLIFVVKKSLINLDEDLNKENEIYHLIFFKVCILLIKNVFDKILLIQKNFNEKENELINNIIIFIQNNIIYSDFKTNQIKYINKHFLLKHDCNTIKLIDLYQIIAKTNSENIIQNYLNLISDIYSFSFNYENIMKPLLKQMEPLFINLNTKDLDKINDELSYSNFPILLIKSLINKENKISSEKICLIKEGFYIKDNKCIIANIKSLENEFTIIFSSRLEKTKENEFILFSITSAEKNYFLKFYLRYNLKYFELTCEELKDNKTQIKELKVKIESEKNYIMAIIFKKGDLRVRYIKDDSIDLYNKGQDIKIKNFKKENIKIYFGCDFGLKTEKVQNKFNGIFGNILIINTKNCKSINPKTDFESDFIIETKSDYKNIINLLYEKEIKENNIFINKKNIIKIKSKLNNIPIEKFISLDNIKLIISPEYFKLLNYYDEIDYIYNKNNILENNNNEYFIKRKYLNLKSESNDNEKAIIINTSYFNKNFHIFKNVLTLDEFIKYDGIHLLSLQMEYYYQILNNLKEKKIQKETKIIKNICKKIEAQIFESINFIYENILKNISLLNISLSDISKYFYEISITIVEYIDIEEINIDIIKYLLKIVKEIKSDNEIKDFINELKINIIGFILNPNLYKRDEVNLETLHYTLETLLQILENNLKDEYFKTKIKCEEFYTQVLSMLWIFDDIIIKDKNNISNESLIKDIKKFYTEILFKCLEILVIKKEEDEYQLEISETKNINKNEIKLKNIKSKEEIEKEKENIIKNKLIELIFEILFEHRDNTNIFCTLLNIIQKLNLIQNTEMVNVVKKIKKIIKEKNREEKNTKNKIISSCIRYLVQIYLVDNDDETIKEKNFHSFIKKLGMNFDVIYSLISSINILKIDNEEKNTENQINIDKYDETLLNINLKSLTEKNLLEVHIIKSIFEDIVYILNTSGDILAKDLLDILEKNLDLIFNSVKETHNLIFQEFFSSDAKICAEFFYYKWKNDQNKNNFLENLIKKYNILLKLYPNPFFFKFYYFVFKEIPDNSNDDINDKNKLSLLSEIINSLKYFITKDKDDKDDIDISIIFNLFNFALLLNFEYEKKNSLIFQKNKFQTIFFDYIYLLDKTGVLYSNYFIELKDFNGKIISEIIYDIYFNISNYNFNASKFINVFVRFDEKEKQNSTIFYFIDILKEKYIEKDKKAKEDIKGFIPNYEKIIEVKNKLKANSKVKLFLGKSIYKIEHVNLSIYFLAKSFIYYKKRNLKPELSKLLMDTFLQVLNDDIYDLYTKKSRFYGNELVKSFPLYYFAKAFIETNIIPDKKFEKYIDYINNEMPMELKEEYNLESCYSSRLCKNKKLLYKKNSLDENELNEKKLNKELYDNDINNLKRNSNVFTVNSFNSQNNLSIGKTSSSSKTVLIYGISELDLSYKSNNESSKLSNSKDEDSSSLSFMINTEKINLNVFSNLKKDRQIILNGKKFFFKKIFGECFKNLLFNDNNFKKVKLTFLLKYRNFKNIKEDTKQLNYPSVQKNYSNSIEPKIFLKKYTNFYDKFYLNISHKYLKKDIIYKKVENLDFYPHIFKFKYDENIKYLFCEIVSLDYITLGKMFFFEDYIIFKSESEDPRENLKDLDIDIFIKYGISMKNKDFPSKNKFIVLYSKFISEIIQRRTLLINNSLEIFMKNGKSYFFNFFRRKNVEKAYQYFNEINQVLKNKKQPYFDFCTDLNKEDIKKLVNSFKKGKITNNEYLLKLNKYSSRTYNDTSQYPIFPWLLKKYNEVNEALKCIWSKEQKNMKDILIYFRDMNYPITQQTEEKRQESKNDYIKEEKEKNEDDEDKFPHHWIKHYSASAYIYYYLMRLNPYLKSIIKLQEDQLENPDRTFNNFKDTEETLVFQNDNRELIPDFFTYFDFLLNLNCNLFGNYSKEILIDDFSLLNNINNSNYYNRISSFVIALSNNNKILNNYYVSKIINNWVDIIFGYKQLPSNNKERLECCNIYPKASYEQYINIEEDLKPFEEKINLNQKNEKEEYEFKMKITPIITNIINLGVCPKKILDEKVVYDGKQKIYETTFKNYKFGEDKLIYFNYINDDDTILIKDIKKSKTKTRIGIIIEKKNLKEKEKETIIYNLSSMNLFKEKNSIKDLQLYHYNYAFTTIYLKYNKMTLIVLLSCRYFGNFFRAQLQDLILNIYYEDFITVIKRRNSYENDNIFFTGLINGKLTEWGIIPYQENNIKNKKRTIKCNYNLDIKEKKHVYAHKSSITAIEIYLKQNLIITAGEDKYIYIRKLFDFELLTSINLLYSFGNPIISKYLNIFPSLIKVSDLNLLYVMIYDYDSKNYFIRGYNLNGIFFAQSDKKFFIEGNYLMFNNFSFTKYSNLIVGFYNSNNFYVLNSGILSPIWVKELEEMEEKEKEKKKEKKEKSKPEIGNKMINFNANNGEFYILKNHEIIFSSINDKMKLKEFESF